MHSYWFLPLVLLRQSAEQLVGFSPSSQTPFGQTAGVPNAFSQSPGHDPHDSPASVLQTPSPLHPVGNELGNIVFVGPHDGTSEGETLIDGGLLPPIVGFSLIDGAAEGLLLGLSEGPMVGPDVGPDVGTEVVGVWLVEGPSDGL